MPPAHRSEHPELPLDEFLSDDALHRLVATRAVVRAGMLLTASDGRRFALLEAVRVLGSAPSSRPTSSHGSDPYGFTGLVDTVGNMLRRGFVMSSERVALGRRAYDVEYGWLLTPVPTASADASGINPRIG